MESFTLSITTMHARKPIPLDRDSTRVKDANNLFNVITDHFDGADIHVLI